MNLQKLFEMQAGLDQHIIETKGLQGQDLLDKKILALQVELGELANEWRGFKFWSENQEPKPPVHNWDVSEDGLTQEWLPEWGYESYPLLEEYVDCLHFILSIGLEHGFDKDVDGLSIEPLSHSNIVDTFSALMRNDWDAFQPGEAGYYHEGLEMFLALGEDLGFTEEQIETAYLAKNKTNHERQLNGY